MFKKLNKNQFKLIIPLLDNSHLLLNILPVIYQTFDGEIWVDNELEPNVAYIFDTRHGHFLIGNIDKNIHFTIDFIKTIFKERFSNKEQYFSLIYSNNWIKLLKFGFIEQLQNSSQYKRQLYKYTGPITIKWESLLPEGIRVVPVTKEILNRQLKNSERVISELKHMWGQIDNFFHIGFGTCAISDDSLAGWCLGEYFVNNFDHKLFGIGIETLPEYQKKGIATVMALSLIELGLQKGYTIYWDCFKDNIASLKTAIKIGFSLELEYEVIEGKY